MLQKYNHQTTILLGDFNSVSDPKRDRKCVIGQSPLQENYQNLLVTWLKVWRFKNPKKSTFTFFSSRHNTLSQIYMIWASADLLLDTHDIEILLKLLADDNPLFWSLRLKKTNFHICLTGTYGEIYDLY